MSDKKSPKKPLKLFGKVYSDPTPNEIVFLLVFILFMLYGLVLNYTAIGLAVEMYTGINAFIAIVTIFLTTRIIKRSNFLGIGKDISKITWLTLNMIGLYCVLNYFDWSSINKFGLTVFSIVGFVQILFFPQDNEHNEEVAQESNKKEDIDK